MRKLLIVGLLAALCAGGPLGCTNMSKTQQGVASGAALGALAGAVLSNLPVPQRGRTT